MQDAPLTAGDVAAINAARLTLRSMQRRAEHRSSLHLLADAAEGDLFDVLNVARSYYPQAIADDTIYLQRAGERPAEVSSSARVAGTPTPPAELVTMLDAVTLNACRSVLKAAGERLPLRDGLRALCDRAGDELFDVLLTAECYYEVPLSRAEVFGYDAPDEAPDDEPEPESDRRAEVVAELERLAGVGADGDDVAAERKRRLQAELDTIDNAVSPESI